MLLHMHVHLCCRLTAACACGTYMDHSSVYIVSTVSELHFHSHAYCRQAGGGVTAVLPVLLHLHLLVCTAQGMNCPTEDIIDCSAAWKGQCPTLTSGDRWHCIQPHCTAAAALQASKASSAHKHATTGIVSSPQPSLAPVHTSCLLMSPSLHSRKVTDAEKSE